METVPMYIYRIYITKSYRLQVCVQINFSYGSRSRSYHSWIYICMSSTYHLYVIFISSICHLHIFNMSSTYLHVIYMSSTYHLYVIYMMVTCHLHIFYMSSTCHLYHLHYHLYVIFISSTYHIYVIYFFFFVLASYRRNTPAYAG